MLQIHAAKISAHVKRVTSDRVVCEQAPIGTSDMTAIGVLAKKSMI